MPSILGIRRSSRIRSGLKDLVFSSPSTPSLAPCTVYPPLSNFSFKPVRRISCPRPLELWLFFLFPTYSTLFLIKGYFYTYSIAVFRQFVKSSEGYSNEILANFPARGKQKTRKQLRVRYEKGSPPRGSDPG